MRTMNTGIYEFQDVKGEIKIGDVCFGSSTYCYGYMTLPCLHEVEFENSEGKMRKQYWKGSHIAIFFTEKGWEIPEHFRDLMI